MEALSEIFTKFVSPKEKNPVSKLSVIKDDLNTMGQKIQQKMKNIELENSPIVSFNQCGGE